MVDPANKRVLYWGSGSGPCWRVQIALKEKELPYEDRLLEFSKKEHKSEEVLQLNPRGQVPVLVDGEVVISESIAAVIWLAESYPTGSQLLPPPDKKDARALAWQRMAEAQVLGDKVTKAFHIEMWSKKSGKPRDEDAFGLAVEALREELGVWEGYLSRTQYLAGPAFSLADVVGAPALLSAQRYGATFANFPKVATYVELIAARPSIAATFPPHWRDTPRGAFLAVL